MNRNPAPASAGVDGAEQPVSDVIAGAPDGAATLPSVTVVITCYNHGRYLADAIRSAQRQTHPAERIIVVDDGSRDDSAAVAAQFDVDYHYQTNAGPSAARNTALALVTTEFVTFLDADDVLHPTALADGAHSLQQHPECGFTFGRYRVRHANGSFSYIANPEPDGVDGYGAMLKVCFIGSHCSVMYRVDALREIEGFDPELRACEDHDVYLRLLQTRPYARHQGIVTDYLHHGNNTIRDYVTLVRWCLRLIEKHRPYALTRPAGSAELESAYRNHPGWWARLALADIRRDAFERRNVRRAARQARRLVQMYPYALRLALAQPFVGEPPDHFHSRRALQRPSWLRRTVLGAHAAPIQEADATIVAWYEHRFLERHAADLLEPLLELGTSEHLPILSADLPQRTVVHVRPQRFAPMLADARRFPDESQQCIVCQIPAGGLPTADLPVLLRQIRRVLRPTGVALLTLALPQLLATGARARMANDLRAACEAAFPDTLASLDIRMEGNYQTHPAAMAGKRAYTLDELAFDDQTTGFELLVTVRVERHANTAGWGAAVADTERDIELSLTPSQTARPRVPVAPSAAHRNDADAGASAGADADADDTTADAEGTL